MEIVEDDDEANSIETLPVGCISVESEVVMTQCCPDEKWCETHPIWLNRQALARDKIGDCYQMTAEYLLNKFQPYPGKNLLDEWNHNHSPYNRFSVKKVHRSQDKYPVHDRFTEHGIIIDKSKLANPKFNITHWFARKCACVLRLKKPKVEDYPPQLENPVVFVTQKLLQNGINSHFPNTKPDTWSDDWFFMYLQNYGSTTYVITNDDLGLKLEIDLSMLENPKFNLINWYYHHATRFRTLYRN